MSLRALWSRVASAPENDLASPPDRLRELQEPVLERQAGLGAAGQAEGEALSHLGEPVEEQEEKGLRVVHCKRERFDAYIGRPSKWGNPFTLNAARNREAIIASYEAWLRKQPELMAALPELRGKVLGCWCAPKPCHGDVLLRLANAQPEEKT
jgi:hypothetical protein